MHRLYTIFHWKRYGNKDDLCKEKHQVYSPNALKQDVATQVLIPVAQHQRIQTIDVLRGVALFGIFLVNQFEYILFHQKIAGGWKSPLEQGISWFVIFFAYNKFVTMFSFLFGLGFAIQLERAQEKGRSIVPFYLSRLGVLFLIGLAHFILLWDGDILVHYAEIGLGLLLFARCRLRTILFVAVGLFTCYALMNVGEELFPKQFSLPPVYAYLGDIGGSYSQFVMARLHVVLDHIIGGIVDAPHLFTLFLLGLYAGKRRILHEPAKHLPLLRRVFWWGLGIGLVGNALLLIAFEDFQTLPGPVSALITFVDTFGVPALSFAYLSGLSLLLQQTRWRSLFSPIAAVGQMALTNYILQSLISTLLFYSYGLGLSSKASPLQVVGLTVLIYALQIPFSNLWMRHFHYGPLEWLWRSLTYRRLQPFRRSREETSHKEAMVKEHV